MTGAGALLLDPDPHRVLVAVDPHFEDALPMARGFPFTPQRSTRAAKVPGFAGRDGPLQGLCVHVGDHQHVARVRIGGNANDEPIGIEFRSEGAPFLDRIDRAGLGER